MPEAVPDPPGSGYEPPETAFDKPEVTFSAQEVTQLPEAVADPSAPPAFVPLDPVVQIIPVAAPILPAPAETPAAPAPVVPVASAATALTSQVGTGAMALTTILVFLVTGIWFYGNRLASQLPVRRNDHA
jgi:hypothetical protein